MASRGRDYEEDERSVRRRTEVFSSDSSGDELPDAGLDGGARPEAVADGSESSDVESLYDFDFGGGPYSGGAPRTDNLADIADVFGSDNSGDELPDGGAPRTDDLAEFLAVFGSDSSGDGLPDAGLGRGPYSGGGARADAQPVHDNAATLTKGLPSRGLLSEMIHKVLGNPIHPQDPTTIVISALKGPIAFRAFSNLRGPRVTATGEWLVPEDAYQSARFTKEFGELVDWWHRLSSDEERMKKLKQIKGDVGVNWAGVPGIFSKLLKTAITKKLPDGRLVMRTGGAMALFAEAGIRFPRLSEISEVDLEKVMKEAIQKKLTSAEFKAYLSAASETFRTSEKLPFWVAESPSRTGTNKWTLDTKFPYEFRKSRNTDKIP